MAQDPVSSLIAPGTVADLGIPPGLAEDLFMRRLFTQRLTTVSKAADALAVSHGVGDELAESLRQKDLIEYQGVEGRDYRVSLTDAGRRMTRERMRSGSHSAAMPVPLDQYQALVEQQRADITINRTTAKKAFADLIMEDGLLDQIGPAFLNDGAVFFYGPAGTGKTSLAERLSRFYEDHVAIPRFLEIDGQLVSVFDPALHNVVDEQPEGLDPRYLLCHRPLIMVGGELTLGMMDLQFNAVSGVSAAPIQLMANNGILVLDDFGRQAASPEEILNRWIVPLSRGIDFLRSSTGTKFTVPFELKFVISTNLDPSSLGDDAFLRRLRNKVYVGPCSDAAFTWILVKAADRHRLQVTPQAADYLAEVTRRYLGELRPYVAVDICELAVGICQYDQLAHNLNDRLIDRVASIYFVHDQREQASDAPTQGAQSTGTDRTPLPTSADLHSLRRALT